VDRSWRLFSGRASTAVLRMCFALLDEVEVGEIELAPPAGSAAQVSEISPAGEIGVDEAGEDAGDEGVAIAMALEVILDRLRIAGDPAGVQERLGVRWTEAGEGDAKNAGDGLVRRIEQLAGNQPGGDEQFRRCGCGEGAEQIIVFGRMAAQGSRWAIWSVGWLASSSGIAAASYRW